MRWLLLFTAIFAARPALAQIPSSSAELREIPGEQARIDGAIEMRRLAGCATRLNRSYARSLLNSIPASDAEDRTARQILKVMEHCMNEFRPAIRVEWAPMRGAVAEYAYLEAHPTPPDFASIDHSGQKLPEAWTSAKLDPAEMSELVSQDFAQCVVSNAPEQADSILRTVPRSPDELGAINKIKPFLGPCLLQGHTYTMDAAAVRSYLAQALQRGMTEWPVVAKQGG